MRGWNCVNFPVAKIIPAVAFRAEDLNAVVPSAIEILLNGLIGAVRVANKDKELLSDDFV